MQEVNEVLCLFGGDFSEITVEEIEAGDGSVLLDEQPLEI